MNLICVVNAKVEIDSMSLLTKPKLNKQAGLGGVAKACFAAEESEHESTRTIKTTEHHNKCFVLPVDTLWRFVAGSCNIGLDAENTPPLQVITKQLPPQRFVL